MGFDISQSQENVFEPAEHYSIGHPSLNTLSQQQSLENTGFDILDHRHQDTSLDTQSRENLFDPVQYHTEGHSSLNTLSRQPTGNMGSDSWSY